MKSRMERILNLLVDEIDERLQAREQRSAQIPPPAPQSAREPESGPMLAAPATPVTLSPSPAPLESEPEPEPEPEASPATLLPSHAAQLMARLAVGLLIAIVLINIPIGGRTLATAMPDSASLILRDGLVVKEEGDEKIYVYQGDAFRWISSLDAFEHHGYTWGDVNEVPDGYLDDYAIGPPLHVLLKCPDSPHIYRLEGGEKRWIRDIDSFSAEGHVWEDVRFVSCQYLRSLPDGETIPPGAGDPPQP